MSSAANSQGLTRQENLKAGGAVRDEAHCACLIQRAIPRDLNHTTEAQFAADIATMVARVRADVPGMEVLLMSNYDSGSPWNAQNAAGMEDAASVTGAAFLNVYEAAGNKDFWINSGYRLSSNDVHYTSAGSQYMGNFVYNAFKTDRAGLTPERSSTALLGVLGLLSIRRRRRGS